MDSKSPAGYLLLALGIVAASWILGTYWYKARASAQYVTVKGLSERQVRADRASWTLGAQYGARSTADAEKHISEHITKVEGFLLKQGFEKSEFKVSTLNITRNAYQQAVDPFTVDVKVTVETSNVDLVEQSATMIADVIALGIPLSGDRWTAGPRYFFTDFQSIKTEMLAEATQNAKVSAEEFAKNSGSGVGKIKYANQGVFQLLPASRNNDNAEFYPDKIVRVVSTVDYFLN